MALELTNLRNAILADRRSVKFPNYLRLLYLKCLFFFVFLFIYLYRVFSNVLWRVKCYEQFFLLFFLLLSRNFLIYLQGR